jgi:signal transduction histidine kinase
VTCAAVLALIAVAGWAADLEPRLDVPIEQTLALAVGFVPAGLFLVRHRPRHAVSRLVLSVGLMSLAAVAASTWSATTVGAWLTQWTWWPAYVLIPVILWVFPEGRPRGARRVMARTTLGGGAVGTVLLLLASALAPRTLLTSTGDPLAPLPRALLVGVGACAALTVISTIGSLLSLVRRARRARADDPTSARQYLSLVPAAALFPLGFVLDVLGVPHAFVPALLALPLGLAVAIIQYGLDDLDLAVRRGLVSMVMTALALVACACLVAAAEYALPEGRDFVVTVVGLALLTAVADPVRRRVQRLVGWWLFGTRDDPETVLMSLGRRLQASGAPRSMLSSTAEEVQRSLKVPYVEITMPVGGVPATVASTGRAGFPLVDFPMVRDGVVLGALRVSPRRWGEAFTESEVGILTEIARQAATAAESHRLTLELQRAREDLVVAREEERLRLRRDLHDGLSPIVAGSRMQLLAVRGRLSEPVTQGLVASVMDDLAGASQAIRMLIEGLRPADLDLGLEGALRARVAALLPDAPASVVATGDLTRLPPAPEVAAYRIAVEALTNVAKHATGSGCVVTLTADGDVLEVVIADDGPGPTAGLRRAGGVGTASMRMRAEELGGTLTLGPLRPGAAGFAVTARLPLVH